LEVVGVNKKNYYYIDNYKWSLEYAHMELPSMMALWLKNLCEVKKKIVITTRAFVWTFPKEK
jgi:hypothetical protein